MRVPETGFGNCWLQNRCERSEVPVWRRAKVRMIPKF